MFSAQTSKSLYSHELDFTEASKLKYKRSFLYRFQLMSIVQYPLQRKMYIYTLEMFPGLKVIFSFSRLLRLYV